MPFNIVIAWAIAAIGGAALLVMGLENRRTGSKRERRDPVLDVLMLWASNTDAAVAQGAGLTPASAYRGSIEPITPEKATRATLDLHALHQGTGSATPATPHPEVAPEATSGEKKKERSAK